MPVDLSGYIFDYRAGYVREGCELPGFDVLGENEENTIVTLGGYTAPAQAKAHTSWADCLYEKLGGAPKVRILNGCTDGYSSAQEMTRFIRDVILLKPRLVIILSGFYNFAYKYGLVNDKEKAEFLKTHPFTTPRQIAFLKEITSRFGLGNDEVYYGEERSVPAFEYWLGHMDIINSLCLEFGLRLKVFLQPCAFSGSYTICESEETAIRQTYGVDDAQIETIRSAFQAEYLNAGRAIETRDYIENLSGLFDADADVYEDAVHVKDRFTAKISDDIFECSKSGWLI